jgi:uncharacterized repeat protein (TIGR03803 family)
MKTLQLFAIGVLMIAGLGTRLAQAASEIVLHSFGIPLSGANPYAGVIRDSDGNLYGTTFFGGRANVGAVYKLDATGHETVLYSFTGGSDGANPYAGVVRDSDGNLYGTTYSGGVTTGKCATLFPSGCGVVFKLDAASHETVLYSFTGGADGSGPPAGVILDSAGNLYGTTSSGGPANAGVVYKLDAAGHETVLYSFTGGVDGRWPSFGLLVRDSAGNLYGTTESGGPANAGVVYKLDAAGNETVLYGFTRGVDGGGPEAGVIRDPAGNLYGTTTGAGSPVCLCGVVYKLDASGHQTVLHTFTGPDGGNPAFGSVTLDSAGNLYGTTYSGGSGVVYKLDATGQETVLYSFGGGVDGGGPYAGVILDSAGNLYGTARYGGESGCPPSGEPSGCGVVYKLDATGNETVVYAFTPGPDGKSPFSGVVRDSAGNLYGTTSNGGDAACRCGVVYKLDASGHETVLYNFTGGGDGGGPLAGVIRDSAGNLYGTTNFGGSANAGVVYKLDAAGHETVLFSFTGGADGGVPYAGVILDSAGNLYGTTVRGGQTGAGVVYKLDTTGHETVLYSFTGGVDGGGPFSGVIRDGAGNLYGTTTRGGQAGGGVVYKLDATGHETVLHSFASKAGGFEPASGVIGDGLGNLYGTTAAGGTSNSGVVYKLDAAGHETVLHSFGPDGGRPFAGVIRDSSGNLYGTNYSGGTVGAGVVYKLTP